MPLPLITMEGRMVADPELRFTPGGKAVCSFTVAASKRIKGDDGEWRDGPKLFLRASVWEQQAEHVAESFRKGDHVVVINGELSQREWEDKEGNKRQSYELGGKQMIVSAPVRWNTVTSNKVERSKPKAAPQEDPWGIPESKEPPPF